LELLSVQPVQLLSAWTPWPEDQKLKVAYGVFTSPLEKYAEQMKAVADTWAQDVPPQKLLVVGVNGSAPGVTYKQAPGCQDGHVSNPGISCKEATLLTTGYELGADWVVVVGSDNYVLPRNIEEQLEKADKTTPQILGIFGCGGGQFCEDHKGGLCGGGGYAISRGALDKMVGQGEEASENFIKESMNTASTVSGYWSDQVTSCIARRHGVQEVQLAGLYGWKLCPSGHDGEACAFDDALYRKKILSSNPKPLTFHYIEPNEMRSIHNIVKSPQQPAPAEPAAVALTAIDGQKGGAVRWSLLESSAVNDNYKKQRDAYISAVDKARKLHARAANESPSTIPAKSKRAK